MGGGLQLRQILPHRLQARAQPGLDRRRGKRARVHLRRRPGQLDRLFQGPGARVPGGQVGEVPIRRPGPGAGNLGRLRLASRRAIGMGNGGGAGRLRGRRNTRFQQDRLQYRGRRGITEPRTSARRPAVGRKHGAETARSPEKRRRPRRAVRPGHRQRKRALGLIPRPLLSGADTAAPIRRSRLRAPADPRGTSCAPWRRQRRA